MLYDGSKGSLAKIGESVSLSICRFRANKRENIPLSHFKTPSIDLVWLEIEPDQSLRNPRVLQPHLRRLKSLSVYPLAEVRSNKRRNISTYYSVISRPWVLTWSGQKSNGTIRSKICYVPNSTAHQSGGRFLPRPPVDLHRKKSIEKWSKGKEKNSYLIGAWRIAWRVHIHCSFSCQAFIKSSTLFFPLLVSFMWTMSWSAESLVIWVHVTARTYKHTLSSFSFFQSLI